MSLTRPLGARPEDRYTKLPNALLARLTPREHQLVHALLAHRWYRDSTIYPRVGTLAELLGWSRRTVQRTLRRLEDGGWIVTVARYRDDRGQTSNEYKPGPMLAPILPPAEDAPVTVPRDDRRTPASAGARKVDSGKQTSSNRRPERVNTDPAAFTSGELGRWIRT
jgi:DNA-binding transcriptional MocR family regulator